MISTHVLDLATGRPAAGVGVTLCEAVGEGWKEVVRTETDADGRVGDFGGASGPGRFRLRFETETYLGADAFFPEVTLQFVVADRERVHVPLLLSPFGYSTYRGS
jgi:5-hydroxyisourate hydrolase